MIGRTASGPVVSAPLRPAAAFADISKYVGPVKSFELAA
jgi:hypothetical protein